MIHAQLGQGLAQALEKRDRVDFGLTAQLALRIERGAQEIGVVDARDFHRILKGQKQAGGGALLGLHFAQVLALKQDGALGDLILIASGKNIAEDRKSTRLNSSHVAISYAVFCLKKKT